MFKVVAMNQENCHFGVFCLALTLPRKSYQHLNLTISLWALSLIFSYNSDSLVIVCVQLQSINI